jgi:2-polyprenyl-3-methyl-5-hydroxy-6-metoxy-1,4-benzoquinol methylase
MAGLRQEVTTFFNRQAASYDADHLQRLGWSSREAQLTRFAALLDVGSLDGCSVLDVGCGVGDLSAYLARQGLRVEYTGCDLVARNCLEAAGRHANGTFAAADILATTGREVFDYVLACGIFTFAADDWQETVEATLRRMFELCRTGMAANFLSAWSREKIAGLSYVEPATILGMCQAFTSVFKLRHDYLDNDFTLYAYRR